MRSIFFFIFGNVRQFISNSNSLNTKYFYDWSISNSSNTPISNFFLTVRTKEEFTVAGLMCRGGGGGGGDLLSSPTVPGL